MTYLKHIIIFFFVCQSFYATGQKNIHFGERLILGSSLTYIFDFNRENYNIRYDEYTWDKNIAVSLNKAMYVGLSFKNTYTRGSIVSKADYKKERYFLVGTFFQYDFIPENKNRLFAEISWNYGNYCTCKKYDPYKKEGLHYLGIGGGFDFPINRFISIDLGFMVYNIINKIEGNYGKYGYTQYIIGLNFDLISRKR